MVVHLLQVSIICMAWHVYLLALPWLIRHRSWMFINVVLVIHRVNPVLMALPMAVLHVTLHTLWISLAILARLSAQMLQIFGLIRWTTCANKPARSMLYRMRPCFNVSLHALILILPIREPASQHAQQVILTINRLVSHVMLLASFALVVWLLSAQYVH